MVAQAQRVSRSELGEEFAALRGSRDSFDLQVGADYVSAGQEAILMNRGPLAATAAPSSRKQTPSFGPGSGSA